MAKTVSEMPRSQYPGGARKYPWDQWLNGEIWCLRRGVDFQVQAMDLGGAARSAGQRRGLKLVVHVHGDEIYIQASPRA